MQGGREVKLGMMCLTESFTFFFRKRATKIISHTTKASLISSSGTGDFWKYFYDSFPSSNELSTWVFSASFRTGNKFHYLTAFTKPYDGREPAAVDYWQKKNERISSPLFLQGKMARSVIK